jgi:hypothetical protein
VKGALAGAILSTAVTVLALPRTAASDTYWIIVGLGVLPYAAFAIAAKLAPRRWLTASVAVYALLDVALRGVRLLGPESLRNPMVVITLPLVGAPATVLMVGLANVVWRVWRHSSSSRVR